MCLKGLAKAVISPTQGWQYPHPPGPWHSQRAQPRLRPISRTLSQAQRGEAIWVGGDQHLLAGPRDPPLTSHGHVPPLKRELIEMEDQPASSRGHPSGLTVKCKITTPTEEDPAPLCPVQGLSTAIQISHLGKGPPQHRPGHGTWGDVRRALETAPTTSVPLSAGVQGPTPNTSQRAQLHAPAPHLVPRPQLSSPSPILGLPQTLPGTHPRSLAQVGNSDARQAKPG